jgi:uncharacterized membrane protein
VLPLLVVTGFVACAGVTVGIDATSPPWAGPVRGNIATVITPQASSAFLQTLTPGLITAVSIIFFILLMAVNHQAAAYSPAVLDQFLRRRGNQLFFGLFIGLLLYALLALALIPPGQALLSVAVILGLTVVAFLSLLAMIYGTIDQLRPSSAAWTIHELAESARAHQAPLLARCRSQRQFSATELTPVVSANGGYVVRIDGDALQGAIAQARGEIEIELTATLGTHMIPGGVLAKVRGDDGADRERVADRVLDAFTLGRVRDIDRDASYGAELLGSMAWSAAAGSHDPEAAMVAVRSLGILLNSWGTEDTHTAGDFGGPLPIVYPDTAVTKIIDGLLGLIPATGNAAQHQTASGVLVTIARVLPQLTDEPRRVAVDRLERVLPTSLRQTWTGEMDHALEALRDALSTAGYGDRAHRVRELRDELNQQHRMRSPAATDTTTDAATNGHRHSSDLPRSDEHHGE